MGGREGLYWFGQWNGRSVLIGSVGGRVCTGWASGNEGMYLVGSVGGSVLGGLVGGRSVLDVLVGGRVCTGWVVGREGL